MIIFDLDQTLVNTQPVERLRAAKSWGAVMAKLPQLSAYDGIHELLVALHERGDRLAIVTKSPDMIAKAFIKRFNWPIDIVIGSHQVKRRKPDPEGLLLAMKTGASSPEETFHIGDQAEDTQAARAAGVTAIGSAWGIADLHDLKASQPDQLFTTVPKLSDFLLR